MPQPIDDQYCQLARDLADTLMRWARHRDSNDQKQIGALQTALCQLRRRELDQARDQEEKNDA
jgi:hypothetical protein